jgi:hypothetical protein
MRRLSRLIFVLICCAVAAASQLRAEKFQSPQFVGPKGAYFDYALAGEFTGSGRQDLVYLSHSGSGTGYQNYFDVLQNLGQRQFKDLGSVNVPGYILSGGLTGDFNHDGKLDLVFLTWAGEGGYSLYFYAGNGDGTFATPVPSTIAKTPLANEGSPLESFAGNLVGDGHLDLAVASEDSANVVDLLAGDGTGKFTLKTSVRNSDPSLSNVVDVNGDGLADLVFSTFRESNQVQVDLNEGNGKFKLETAYVEPNVDGGTGSLESVVFADLNGDGKVDLVTSDASYIFIGLGNGDGTFAQTTQFPLASQGWLISAQDMNGDGKPDLVLLEDEGIDVILQGEGLKFTALPVALTNGWQRSPALADIDGDGNVDVMVPNELPTGTEVMSLLWGEGGGKLASGAGYRTPYEIGGGAMARFTLGPAPDIAVQPYTAEYPLTLQNLGNGTFQLLADPNATASGPAVPNGNLYQVQLQAGDFNGDGKPDLLAYGNQELTDYHLPGYGDLTETIPGLGNGKFGAALIAAGYPNTQPYQATAAGDLNGDGRTDVAIAYDQEVDILLGQANGTLKLSQSFVNANYLGATQTVFGDFNGDGILDMAILNSGNETSEVQILLGFGDGTFNPGQMLSVPFQLLTPAATVGDVDGDGKLDLLMSSGTLIYPIYGNGDGTFEIGATIAAPAEGAGLIVAADVNRDGWPDLVIFSGGVVVRHGLGNRTWDAGDAYVTGGGDSYASWVQDLNQDGFPDIAMVDGGEPNSSIVGVLLNEPEAMDLKGTLTILPSPLAEGSAAIVGLSVQAAIAGELAPSGAVQFTVDSAAAGSGELTDGKLQMTLQGADTLSPGRHWVVASYAGNASFHAARFTAVLQVKGGPLPTTVTKLTATPSPVDFGSVLTLTATVTASKGTAAGTIFFREGPSTLGRATLNSAGVARLPMYDLAPGMHTFTARYAPTPEFATSVSMALPVTVLAPATISFMATPTTAYVGQKVTLSAQVSSIMNPAGAVNFYDGKTLLGIANLTGAETATLAVSFHTGGSHTLTAVYHGDAKTGGVSSTPFAEYIRLNPTTTTVTATPNPALALKTVTFTAKVSSSTAAGLAGAVSFYAGSKLLGSAPVANGTALVTAALEPGSFSITASYAGNATFAASSAAAVTLRVQPVPSSVAVTSSLNPAAQGSKVTFTATITAATEAAAVIGTVTFFDGTKQLGSPIGVSAGSPVSYSTANLAVGAHSITAVYSGAENVAGSTSAALKQTISAATGGR